MGNETSKYLLCLSNKETLAAGGLLVVVQVIFGHLLLETGILRLRIDESLGALIPAAAWALSSCLYIIYCFYLILRLKCNIYSFLVLAVILLGTALSIHILKEFIDRS